MPTIRFETKLFKIRDWTILLLPQSASSKLPSRGMVLVKGTVNGLDFRTPLEPDGNGSHWLKVDKTMHNAIGAGTGETVTVEIEPSKDWPEPDVPADVKSALKDDAKAQTLWTDITPMARWDWLRWISSTGKSETRQRRIDATFSKLKGGTRRPCCFNRSMCTVPSVSKNGVLLEPALTT